MRDAIYPTADMGKLERERTLDLRRLRDAMVAAQANRDVEEIRRLVQEVAETTRYYQEFIPPLSGDDA